MRICVCIPTLNARNSWQNLRASLHAQTLQPSEIIILDSSSTDDTAEMAEHDGCRVITIPREEFRHGGTRQHAAELAFDADVIVYLTQDAILADENALSRLVAAFEDASIGAAYGRQLPRTNADPIEAHARLFNYPAISVTRSLENAHVQGFKAIFFSNSLGAYRRAALEQAGGFPRDSNFGEDTVVTARLLQRNWRIAYVADAKAYHSHSYGLREEFERYYRIGQLHGNEPWLLQDFGQVSGEGWRFALSEVQYLLHRSPWLIPEGFLRSALKYIGYKRGRRNPKR